MKWKDMASKDDELNFQTFMILKSLQMYFWIKNWNMSTGMSSEQFSCDFNIEQ